MRINCPDPTDAEIKRERLAALNTWHRAFAWLPVRLDNRRRIWLEHYEWKTEIIEDERNKTTHHWRRLPGAEEGWCWTRTEFTGGW